MARALAAFLRGFGSMLDFNPRIDLDRSIPHKTAEDALTRDWQQIGADFRVAIRRVTHEQGKENSETTG